MTITYLNNILPEQVGKDKRFTVAQWQAIHAYGDNILVSASAGSGKTTVLTRRIIEKIKSGVSVDQLVVVTFTDAATKEMRERIRLAIEEAYEKATNDENSHLANFLQMQLTLLPQAHISTIHAFCSKLIREHFQMIGIDPNFGMLTDSTEIALLQEDVLSQVKTKWYDQDVFVKLAMAFSNRASSEGISKLILDLYTFSRSKPDPLNWLRQLGKTYAIDTLMESPLYQSVFMPLLQQNIDTAIWQLTQAHHLTAHVPDTAKVRRLLNEEMAQLQLLQQQAFKNAPYETLKVAIENVKFAIFRLDKVSDEALEGIKDAVKAYRDAAKKTIEELKTQLFFASEKRHIQLIKQAGEFVDAIVAITIAFYDAYQKAKRDINRLDYSDLELLALEILQPKVNECRELSSIALYYQLQLHEVMVDEYQDVNRLQEAILTSLSNGKNMFMVGDVKQSIYGFRMADPSLFQEKYEQYKENNGGVRIILQENFRSRQHVLGGTNYIFQQIMDEHLGELVYDDDAMLVQGNDQAFPTDASMDISLLVYEKGASTEVKDDVFGELDAEFDKFEGEMRMVAHKIRELIASKTLVTVGINDEGYVQRPVTYQDIVLLLPTKTNNLHIKRILESYHIPVAIQESESYFKRSEIVIMLSLLQIIDNPHQDIPLVAVLRSPIGKLKENELAAIRIATRPEQQERMSGYYDALLSFLERYEEGKVIHNAFHDTLYEKCTRFVERLTIWRHLSAKESLVNLIWQIYKDTHFLDYVGGLKNGKQRQANLHGLYSQAKAFEKSPFKGLFQFVRYIENMQDRAQDIAEVDTSSQRENVVQVMTIHNSKGLEFPFVFVCDLTRQFNTNDLKARCLWTEQYGVGMMAFDVDNRWAYPTLMHGLIKTVKKQKNLAEEMRKLYVALTRAKEKLFIVGSANSQEGYWQSLEKVFNWENVVLPKALREVSAPFDWIKYGFARHQKSQNDFLVNPKIPVELSRHAVDLHYEFYSSENLGAGDQDVDVTVDEWLIAQKHVAANEPFEVDVEQSRIEKVAFYRYPFAVETKTTSYQAVSELKRIHEDPDVSQMVQHGAVEQKYRIVQNDFAAPKFLQTTTQVSATHIGTATHLVMQLLDWSSPIGLQVIDEAIDALIAKGTITLSVAQKINRHAILAFVASDFGQYLQKNAHRNYREVPLSLLVNAEALFKDVKMDNQHILVHGIVDGYVVEEDGIVVYDYKTDVVKNGNTQIIVNRYQSQIRIYADALSEALQLPVKRMVLCLLSAGENIDVDV